MTGLQFGYLSCGGSCNYKLIAAPYPHAYVSKAHTILISPDKIHIIKDFPPVIYYFILFIRYNWSRLIPMTIEFDNTFHIN